MSKENTEKLITPKEISELLNNLVTPMTLGTWLGGYRFTKFERLEPERIKPRRIYTRSKEFFDTLYSFIIDRSKSGVAGVLLENLKKEGIEVEYKGIWKDIQNVR